MALSSISTGARNAGADGFVDQIDLGATDASGDVQIATAAFATILAQPTFANPAFGAAAAGVATANAITDETNAPATGTAAVGRIRDRNNATVANFTVGTSGQDLNLNTTSITAGDRVSITSMTITAPAS